MKIKQDNKKKGFLGTLLGTLGPSLLGNMSTGKGILRAGYGNKEGKGMLRAGYGSPIKKKIDSTLSFNKSIVRINLDLIEVILEITCLKQ